LGVLGRLQHTERYQEFGRSPATRLRLELDVGQCLPVVIPDDEAALVA
jgi:hypothetical protein